MKELFAAAGVEGWLHAIDLDTGQEIGWRPDEPVVAASVFKLPLLLTLVQEAAAGRVDLTARIEIGPERAPGGTGISALLDPVTMSIRDIATLMMCVSDNAASDLISDLLGLDVVAGLVTRLGLKDTAVTYDCRGLFVTIEQDLESGRELRALEPAHTNRTTPRDATTLLGGLWRDEIGDPEVCAWARDVLRLQVWPHRLSSGFAEDGWSVGGKTGSIMSVRNEVGVVEHEGGGRWAVAVFTRTPDITAHAPQADAVIGAAARAAVDALRGER